MIEILLGMAYLGGAIGCWLALWDHQELADLRRDQRVIAIVLAWAASALWPTVLAARLVRNALDE